MEKLTLTNLVTPTLPTIADYNVWSLYLGVGEGIIHVIVEDNNKKRITCSYVDEGPNKIATDLMKILNTANGQTKSLHKRILEKLAADGKLPSGTVTGVPD